MTQQINKKDFKKFKDYCEKYIKLFNLDDTDFQIVLEEDDILNARADCSSNIDDALCLIRVSSSWGDKKYNPKDIDEIKRVAKHEVIHALLGKLSRLGGARWVSLDEYSRTEEELVRKLCKLLPDK